MSVIARPRVWPGAHPGQHLFVLGTTVLALGSVVVFALRGVVQPQGAVIFGALIAAGEIARIRLPGDRELAPIATAGGVSYALLLAVGPVPAVHGAFQVIVVTTAAMVLGAAPHAVAGRAIRPFDMARRLLIVSLTALFFRPFAENLAPVSTRSWTTIGVLVGALVLAGALEVVIATAARAGLTVRHFRTLLRDEIRVRAPLGTAVAAAALLIAAAAHVMGWSALIVCTAPLVVTQVAYRRYSGIRATYLQTIRALARVPEAGGYVESGHSRRVSRLAVQLGHDLGMSETELLELEYAALMHDIGQLSLHDPKPSGATVHATAAEQRRIAELGAEVVRQTGVLDRVASIIELQAEPPHLPGEPSREPSARELPEQPPLASRIVRVANAYDDLTGGAPDPGRSREALDRICGGTAQDAAHEAARDIAREAGREPAQAAGQVYDPLVVRSLARVLDHG